MGIFGRIFGHAAQDSAHREQKIALDPSETSYRGASRSIRSLRAWLPISSSPQKDFPANERKILVARSRDAFRNHLVARAAVQRARTNIIGRGLRLRSLAPDGLSQQIESAFALWSDDPDECDAEGHSNFYQLQSLAFLTCLISGECFAILSRDPRPDRMFELRVQLIEPDRVATPPGGDQKIVDGLEKDSMGRTTAIWVSSGDGLAIQQQFSRVPVFDAAGNRQVLHIMSDKERPGQVRGVPFLAPILETLFKIEQYTDAELTAASINAMLTVFLEKDLRTDAEPFEVEQTGNVALGNGAIVDLAPGEHAQIVDPTRPNVNFNGFVLSLIRQSGASLEIPGDEILLHYDSSYSAARAVMLQAWRFYITKRDYFVSQFCRQVFNLWLQDANRLDIINLPGYDSIIERKNIERSRWIGPARGAIDELKEAQAASTRINIGVSSIAREAAAMSGEDWDIIHQELAEERARRIADGLAE